MPAPAPIPDPILKAFEASIDDVDPGSRTLVAKITTDAVDRLGQVILPKGIALADYRKNPIILWCHDLTQPPIAKALWIKPADGGKSIVAKAQFAPTDFAMQLFALYQGGYLKQWSIGALEPERAKNGPPSPAEIRANPEWAAASRIYRAIVLHEFSACSVGINQETATLAVAKGLLIPEGLRRQIAEAPVPEPAPAPAPVPPAALPRLIGRTYGQASADLLAEIRRAAAANRAELDAHIDLRRGVV